MTFATSPDLGQSCPQGIVNGGQFRGTEFQALERRHVRLDLFHPAIMPDKLHPALPGYIRWMDAMRPTLNNLLNQAAE